MPKELIDQRWTTSRSHLRRIGVVLLAVLVLAACSSQAADPVASQPTAQGLPSSTLAPEAAQPTAAQLADSGPVCSSPAALTPALAEGPYYKTNSPERSSLIEADTPGTRLTLTGYVLTSDCQPIANALLDFWQADANGQYDNAGYTLRGHQYTDENGRYELITIVPGEYPGRTEHIHFKVLALGGHVLTSQLFLPEVQENQTDRIFDPSLVINITQDNGDSLQASFNFIINQ